MNPTALLLLATGFFLALSTAVASAATPYQVGDVVADFSLVRRDNHQPLRLADLHGKIIFLDWFAWWCPFCQAAAPQLLQGVDQWYESRGGNPDGLEVVHVGVNLQGNQEAQTQNFIQRAGLELVLEDFNRKVANQFFPEGGQPLFAIINGVTNSPSHAPWELVYSRRGYGERDFPVAEFRAAIDAIKKPSPAPVPPSFIQISKHAEGGWLLELSTEPGRTYVIESSHNLKQWTVETSLVATSARESTRVGSAGNEPTRFYRAVTP